MDHIKRPVWDQGSDTLQSSKANNQKATDGTGIINPGVPRVFALAGLSEITHEGFDGKGGGSYGWPITGN